MTVSLSNIYYVFVQVMLHLFYDIVYSRGFTKSSSQKTYIKQCVVYIYQIATIYTV